MALTTITTFNLLAPITISSVQTTTPEFLSFEHRWPLILKQLTAFMMHGHILVLQEIDAVILKAKLFEFLLEHGYMHTDAIFCGPREHATVIAFPSTKFHLERIGHEFLRPHVRAPPFRLAPGAVVQYRVYSEARRRNYAVPWVLLYDWALEKYYYVFGFHASCCPAEPGILILQTEALIRRCYELTEGTPFLLAGDFNCLPGSAVHRFMTTGTCGPSVAPTSRFASNYRLFDPLSKQKHLITNRTPEFSAKIDYIFTSFDYRWELESFHLESPTGPLPNSHNGSDHAPLSCRFALK